MQKRCASLVFSPQSLTHEKSENPRTLPKKKRRINSKSSLNSVGGLSLSNHCDVGVIVLGYIAGEKSSNFLWKETFS